MKKYSNNRKVVMIVNECKFCGQGLKVKSDFFDYYKGSDMVAFTATMGIVGTDKEKHLAIQIDLENASITPDNKILPWELLFNVTVLPYVREAITTD